MASIVMSAAPRAHALPHAHVHGDHGARQRRDQEPASAASAACSASSVQRDAQLHVPPAVEQIQGPGQLDNAHAAHASRDFDLERGRGAAEDAKRDTPARRPCAR